MSEAVRAESVTPAAALIDEWQARVRDRRRLLDALPGWIDQALFDADFIDHKLKARPLRAPAPAPTPVAEEHCEPLSPDAALAEALAQPDYGALEAFCARPISALRHDDGERAALDGAAMLRVLVVGAGPVGTCLAAGLQRALGARVSVLLVERRTTAPGHKRRYSRNWLTHIPARDFEGLLGPDILGLFERIGADGFCGASVRVIESLALLDARRLGVRCLFDPAPAIEQLTVGADVLVDASGGALRWQGAKPLQARDPVDTGPLLRPGAAYRAFGLRTPEQVANLRFELASDGHWQYPLRRGQPIRHALLKVIDIPGDCHAELLDAVRRDNPGNQFYLWPGRLAGEANRSMLLVDLDRRTHDALCKTLNGSQALAEWLKQPTVRSAAGPALLALLRLIVRRHPGAGRVERPFIVAPRLLDPGADLLGPGGVPVVPVGDALHTGNPKSGNGLGAHLRVLRELVELTARL